MLMTKKTHGQFTCPLTLSRPGKPGACLGAKCASWRLYTANYGGRLWFLVDGASLAYCGRAGKPPLEQVRMQFPQLFVGAMPAPGATMSFDEIRERARRERAETL